MFDFEDDDTDRAVITFTYKQYDDEGRSIASVTRTIRNDDVDFLPNILNAFMLFLNGMTFNYVEDVVAVSSSGKEHSAQDI